MTREEAIETLGHVVPFATQNGEKIAEAIDMAIEALQDRPTGECDLISRHDALMELNGACEMWEDDAIVADIIHKLPSIDIVRCKNCRYYNNDYMGKWCGRHQAPVWVKEADFCSWGERREE